MKFSQWLEANVDIQNLGNAVKQTLEFKVPGRWEFDIKPHDWYTDIGKKDSTSIHATLYYPEIPGYFYLSAFAIIEDDKLTKYDSLIGSEGMRITCSLIYFKKQGQYVKLGERSEKRISTWGPYDGNSLRTPYQLAKWVLDVINYFNRDDDDNGGSDDITPTPTPSDQLQPVLV